MKYARSPTALEKEIKNIKRLIGEKKLGIKAEEYILTVLEKHLKSLKDRKAIGER